MSTMMSREDNLEPPQKKKRKSGKSSHCAVNGCSSLSGTGLSFFRIPKVEPKCSQWKQVLGFIGNHVFANLTPQQCHSRIKVCSLHFEQNCFSSESRIHSVAVPSLFLNNSGSGNESDDQFEEESRLKKCNEVNMFLSPSQKSPTLFLGREPAEVITHQTFDHQLGTNQPIHVTPIITVKSESTIDIHPNEVFDTPTANSDDSLDSTNFEPLPPNETFMKDKYTQTSIDLTPILLIKEGNPDQNSNFKIKSNKETTTTIDDVYRFLEQNYSTEACSLLKAQLDVLEKQRRINEVPINMNLKHIRIKKI